MVCIVYEYIVCIVYELFCLSSVWDFHWLLFKPAGSVETWVTVLLVQFHNAHDGMFHNAPDGMGQLRRGCAQYCWFRFITPPKTVIEINRHRSISVESFACSQTLIITLCQWWTQKDLKIGLRLKNHKVCP